MQGKRLKPQVQISFYFLIIILIFFSIKHRGGDLDAKLPVNNKGNHMENKKTPVGFTPHDYKYPAVHNFFLYSHVD